MKTLVLILIVTCFFFANCSSTPNQPAGEQANEQSSEIRELYQLKIYKFDSEEEEVLVDHYLQDAFLPGLKRVGIQNVGVFKKRLNEDDTIRRTYVLIPFNTMDQYLSLETDLLNDQQYNQSEEAYLTASHEKAPYQRIESILLKAFRDFPELKPTNLKSPRAERIYELRSYESPTEAYYRNKVEMFNEGGEIKLFDQLGFNAVFYADVMSGPNMPNLMYMTTFADQQSRDAHWEAFVDAPEWKELVGNSYYNNNVSHADIIFLYPTEYSDY